MSKYVYSVIKKVVAMPDKKNPDAMIYRDNGMKVYFEDMFFKDGFKDVAAGDILLVMVTKELETSGFCTTSIGDTSLVEYIRNIPELDTEFYLTGNVHPDLLMMVNRLHDEDVNFRGFLSGKVINAPIGDLQYLLDKYEEDPTNPRYKLAVRLMLVNTWLYTVFSNKLPK